MDRSTKTDSVYRVLKEKQLPLDIVFYIKSFIPSNDWNRKNSALLEKTPCIYCSELSCSLYCSIFNDHTFLKSLKVRQRNRSYTWPYYKL